MLKYLLSYPWQKVLFDRAETSKKTSEDFLKVSFTAVVSSRQIRMIR